MKTKSFDWDKYLSTATFKDIVENSPELSSRRLPTLYSPDRKWIYFSAVDLDCQTHDFTELDDMFRLLKEAYQLAKEKEDHRKLYLIKVDFIEVCGLLQNLVQSPEYYSDPDALLNCN